MDDLANRNDRVYLAGPDVFLSNALVVFQAKRELCRKYDFTGVSPFDNQPKLSALPKHEQALRISAANEELIRSCGLVIANLTPFRGPSADVGTVYEMGFARALGLPLFAYTNVAGSLLERTRKWLEDRINQRATGEFEDSFGMSIEDFDCVDNLMLVGAVEAGGTKIVVNPVPDRDSFTNLAGFEKCLEFAARQRADAR